MMKKYLVLILLFSVLTNGCVRHNRIDFSSSEAFFSSLNETKLKETKNNASKSNNLKKSKINNTYKKNINKPFSLTLSSYEKQLKLKFGSDEFAILKIFNNPSLTIKHGKIKNLQFHLMSCHLDLFFLNDGENYKFRHFDFRPSAISSNLDKKKCVEELNYKFILIRDPR